MMLYFVNVEFQVMYTCHLNQLLNLLNFMYCNIVIAAIYILYPI